MVKASAYKVGDLDLIPGMGRSPGEENGNPLRRSLIGYNPWGLKGSDTTEQLHFHLTDYLECPPTSCSRFIPSHNRHLINIS